MSFKRHGISNHRYLIVCPEAYLGLQQRKHQSSLLLTLCKRNPSVPGGFLPRRASNAESIPVVWRHHGSHDRSQGFITDLHLHHRHKFISSFKFTDIYQWNPNLYYASGFLNTVFVALFGHYAIIWVAQLWRKPTCQQKHLERETGDQVVKRVLEFSHHIFVIYYSKYMGNHSAALPLHKSPVTYTLRQK